MAEIFIPSCFATMTSKSLPLWFSSGLKKVPFSDSDSQSFGRDGELNLVLQFLNGLQRPDSHSQQNPVAVTTPDNILPQMACESLCAVVPEHNAAVTIHQLRSPVQAVQDGSKTAAV